MQRSTRSQSSLGLEIVGFELRILPCTTEPINILLPSTIEIWFSPCEHVGSQIRLLFDELCRKLWAFREFKADDLLQRNQLSLP